MKMTPLKLKHVGVVVKDIAEYLAQNVVSEASTPVFDDIQDADICFISFPGTDVAVELIQPRGPASKTYGFLAKKKGGLHHVCYGAASVEEVEKIIEEKRLLKIFGPVPAKALGCRFVIFAYTRNNDIVEFEIG